LPSTLLLPPTYSTAVQASLLGNEF